MNRIIIIGNGFDLAHQLATRYEDFINWYWEDRGSYLVGSFGNHIDDGLCSFKLKEEVGLLDGIMFGGGTIVYHLEITL